MFMLYVAQVSEQSGGQHIIPGAGWFRVKSCHVICWRVHVIVWRAVSRLSVPCHNVSGLIRVKIDPRCAVSMLDVNVEVQC